MKTPSEYSQQAALVKRCQLENIFIHSIENSLHFPIPNWFPPIVKKYIITMLAKLVKQRINNGMVKGTPDLLVPEFKLYIEMKKEGGVVSKEQIAVHEILILLGYDVRVFYSAKDAWGYIEKKRKEIK